MDEECCEVVVTAADAEWLAGLTRTLVEEVRVALHTRRSLVPAVVERTQELHPYDIPCVLALSLTGGSPAYLQWIVEQTREP